MDSGVTLKSLSAAQRLLVRLMQEINFGRFENLLVRNGQPYFYPPPRVVREVKFSGENGPRAEQTADDFVLKSQVLAMLRYMEALDDATIDCLFVKHGLPFSMNVATESPVAAA